MHGTRINKIVVDVLPRASFNYFSLIINRKYWNTVNCGWWSTTGKQ